MIRRVVAIALDRASDQFDRRFVAAGLVGNAAKQVQNIGVIRHYIENPPIMGFRLGQAPGLMVRHTRRQKLGNLGSRSPVRHLARRIVHRGCRITSGPR